MNLIASQKFFLKNRGPVYTINIAQNNLPVLRKEISEKLLGKAVIISFDKEPDNYCNIKGIEFFPKDDYEYKDVGILVDKDIVMVQGTEPGDKTITSE